jgi:carboxymethylenebutenolidase
MRKSISLFMLLLFCSVTAWAQHTHHSPAAAESMETQDWAKQQLAKSSRHQEWVKVKNGAREVSSFVVYPEVKNKATAVVVIHEIFGMSDWVQSLTDQLAAAGYIAIAPDLLSGMGPNGGGTSSLERSAIDPKIRDLPPDQITADLNAVVDYVAKLPASNGKVVVTGYCWGGSQSFRFATNNPNIKAAYVFYGSGPMTAERTADKEVLARIKAPVYGFYAGNDARINETLPTTTEAMKALNKTFEPVIYEGSGHGFMRAGDAPQPVAPTPKGDKEADDKAAADYQKALEQWKGNKKARDEAWVRWKKLLAAV